MPAASSPAQFLVTLHDFGFSKSKKSKGKNLGRWSSLSGGNASSEIRRYHEGGSPSEEVAGGPGTREDTTIGRPFRYDRDVAVWKWAEKERGKARGDVQIQPLDGEFKPKGRPIVYAKALLMGVNAPEIDAEAVGDVARIELTFALSGDA